MLTLSENCSVVIVIAHSDDEWWGLGGTILRLRKEFQADSTIILVSNTERGDNTGQKRKQNTFDLCSELDMTYYGLNMPTNYLDRFKPDIITELDKLFSLKKPEIVFTHFPGDLHQDHVAVSHCVNASLRAFPATWILQMESPFNLGFRPNFFVAIDGYTEGKHLYYRKYFLNEIKRRPEYSVEQLKATNTFWGKKFLSAQAEAFVFQKGGLRDEYS